MRRPRSTRNDGQVRDKEVSHREQEEEHTPRHERAQPLRHARVEKELQSDADDAQDGHGHTNGLRMHANTAGETKGQPDAVVRSRRIKHGRREEDKPERVEGADVEREEELGKQRQGDIPREYPAKRQPACVPPRRQLPLRAAITTTTVGRELQRIRRNRQVSRLCVAAAEHAAQETGEARARAGSQVRRRVPQRVERLLEAQPHCCRGEQEKHAADNVGRRVGEVDKEADVAEQTGIRARRVGQDATQNGTDDDANVERHGEEEECTGLEPLFADDFRDPASFVSTKVNKAFFPQKIWGL